MTSGETITISKAEYQQFLDQKSEIEWLKHQLEELKRMIYGSKRERFIAPDPLQSTLFDWYWATFLGQVKNRVLTLTH